MIMNLHQSLLRGWRRGLLQPVIKGALRWPWVCEWQAKSLFTYKPFRHPQNGTALSGMNGQNRMLPRGNVFTKNIVRWNSSEGVTWLWEVNDTIKGFNEASKHGTRVGYGEYTFNSVKPLDPEHIRRALEHFTRILPNMRTVIRQRGDSAWFCQLHETQMDFEVLSSDDDLREICFDLLDKGFQDTDSLPWRVRLIARGPNVPCCIEGVKEKYPYQYDLGFMVSHTVGDGVDFGLISRCLHHCLNSVVGGRDVGEMELGVFENNTDLEELLTQRRKNLLQDQRKLDFIKSTLPMIGDVPTIFQAFPRPKVIKPITKHIVRIIDPQVMNSLHSKCSETGVTFNSFALAVCNVALVEVMKEAGLIRNSYKISCIMFVNSRRYRNSKKFLHGCYTIPLTYTSEVQSNTIDSFWEYCKKVNHELHMYYTEEGRALDQAVVQQMLDAESPPFNYTDNPRPVTHDHCIASNGDVTKVLPGTGDHVQLTNVIVHTKIHHYRNAFLQENLTFRGTTRFQFGYATNYFSDETANLIADKAFHIFDVVGK